MPRLVRAVLERQPVAEGARLTTVTDQVSVPFEKKPGEGLLSSAWAQQVAVGAGRQRVVNSKRAK